LPYTSIINGGYRTVLSIHSAAQTTQSYTHMMFMQYVLMLAHDIWGSSLSDWSTTAAIS